MRNAGEIIKNNVKVANDWLRLGSTILGRGPVSGKVSLAELLQGKRAVLYRRGKNGYVQVIFGPEPDVDLEKVKNPGTPIEKDKDGAVRVVKEEKGGNDYVA